MNTSPDRMLDYNLKSRIELFKNFVKTTKKFGSHSLNFPALEVWSMVFKVQNSRGIEVSNKIREMGTRRIRL